MKKIRARNTESTDASLGATQRTGASAMKKLGSFVLAPVAVVSLAAGFFACGSYSSSDSGGSAGSTSPSGGGDMTGGAGSPQPGAGAPNTSGGDGSGGAIVNPNAGTGNDSTGGGAPPGAGAGGAGGGAPPVAGAGGAAPMAGAGGGGAGAAPTIALPCDVLKAGGNSCVSAHSTVRVIVGGYTGPLYQLCKGSAAAGPASCKGTTHDVGSKDGYADSADQDTFCAGTSCTITKIYDQSGQKNDLEPAPRGGAKGTPDNPAVANALKITVNGHSAYGILIKAGIGYRTGCSGCTIKQGNGMVKGDDPESMYWITSQKDLIDGCCFDYGNAETTSNDDGNGTMEALYFGGGVVWGTGAGGKPGPWMMADLENGLYAGWENNQDKNISTNKKLNYDFVTGVLLGDTREKNSNKGRFAIYGGDATAGTLQTMYDGIRPAKAGYVPMIKQGSIILGIGATTATAPVVISTRARFRRAPSSRRRRSMRSKLRLSR